MVFAGGDPLKRADLYDPIRDSVKLGLRTNVSPAATPPLTKAAIGAFKQRGISRMAISLDGPDDASHDSFRGVPGAFSRAMMTLPYAREIGLEKQLQTTVTRLNFGPLGEIAKLTEVAGTKMCSLFFLIVTVPFGIRTTRAMHYRR